MQEAKIVKLCQELDARFSPSLQVMKGFNKGIDVIWPELLEIHDGAYEPALKRLKIETNSLPTVDRVKSILVVEGKKAMLADADHREREWNKSKGKKGVGGKPEEVDAVACRLAIAARDEHAHFACEGIALMRRPDKTREQKLEFFKLMDDQYPGIGWGIEGMRLKGFWEGKPLNPA